MLTTLARKLLAAKASRLLASESAGESSALASSAVPGLAASTLSALAAASGGGDGAYVFQKGALGVRVEKSIVEDEARSHPL